MISLALQNTYSHIELALFNEESCIDILTEEKQYASKNFVILLDMLLKRNHIKLTELTFCTVNQGPSPFTTLRTVITSVNGLHFVLGIPLVGIDGLEAFIEEYKEQSTPYMLVLLNAFAQDVYFCLQKPHRPLYKGYKKIDEILDDVREQIPTDPITFLGNAAQLYKTNIQETFHATAINWIATEPQTCSIYQVGKMGYHRWQKRERLSTHIAPLYLKQHAVYQETGKFRNIPSN